MARAKQHIPGMMPPKKWISKKEAMCYLDLSINEFTKLVSEKGLTVSSITERGSKTYYKVSELDRLFENSIIQKSA